MNQALSLNSRPLEETRICRQEGGGGKREEREKEGEERLK